MSNFSFDRNAMYPVYEFLERGGSMEQLALISQLNTYTIQQWLKNGVPTKVTTWRGAPAPIQVLSFRTLLATVKALEHNLPK